MLGLMVALAVQGAWTVHKDTDPISDRPRVTATLRGDNAAMVFMCARGERPRLIYRPDRFLGRSRYRSRAITYRFDAEPPKTVAWFHANDFAEPPRQAEASEFARKMITSSRLAVRAERYDRKLIESTFELTGSGPAFHQAFQACGITG